MAIQMTNMEGRTEMLLSGGNFPEFMSLLRHMDKTAQTSGQRPASPFTNRSHFHDMAFYISPS